MTIGARPVAEDANIFWIFQDELKAINERREALARPLIPVADDFSNAGDVIDAVGLSLSGGGVRSAAVCLGVLQALDQCNVLRNIDYLSTVSGGGYIGSSLTSTMTKSGGEFVFGNRPAVPGMRPSVEEISDTGAVGHIRNYSNYLIPRGFRDILTGAAIVVRGLIANLALILPYVLLMAALTVWSNPDRSSLLQPDVFGYPLGRFLPVDNFGITLLLSLVGLVLFFAWAVYRSVLSADRQSEFRTSLPRWGAAVLIVVAFAFFCELQAFVVAGMFDVADRQAGIEGGLLLGFITTWVKRIAAVAAPISAAVMFFRQQLTDLLKSSTAASSTSAQIAAILAKAALWIAAAALPLLIWIVYLYLSYWGIINDTYARVVPSDCNQSAISASVNIEGRGLNLSGELQGQATPDGCRAAGADQTLLIGPGTHTPSWLLTWANITSTLIMGRVIDRPMALLYLSVALFLLAISWPLAPNANSLHRLYRDRLSTAFLFDPKRKADARPAANEASIDQGRDFAPLDRFRVSELSNAHAPYHLINAALNIQGSDFANRRGRNADFFLFSKYWIGSVATGYAPMEDFEAEAGAVDLATAMAVSGAAASSNMGSQSIRPLTPTLAMLNIRLGYWLRNPAYWAPSGAIPVTGMHQKPRAIKHKSSLYLWAEISGRLYENATDVYLTDGGHIENLGIYELLRRRCRVIVAVDAEADPSMHLPSLITLQRYARIDLGIRIDLPWRPISNTTLAWMNAAGDPASKPGPSCGPHVAIGTIDYGGGETGYLVYIKSSLTGDENDYVRDYARRYPLFPHESTGDQFFSEEQFEVYRALGFHMASGMLLGHDRIEVVGTPGGATTSFNDVANPAIRTVRDALMAQPLAPAAALQV